MGRAFTWVRRSVDPIGIDLGTRSVRMLQLSRHRGEISIVASAHRALPPGNHTPEALTQLQAEAVAEMLESGAFVGRDAVTALPWDDLQSRSLRLPAMPEEELPQAVQFESAERFGLDPARTEVRFLMAGDVRQGNEVRQEIIVFVADRARVETHLETVRQLGFEPAAIEAGPCALFRGFERFLRRDEDQNSVNAFVELGYTGTRIVIARGPEPIFYKSIPIGGRRFDELIAERLDLSPAEAADIRVRLHQQHVADLSGQSASLAQDERVSDDLKRTVFDTLRPLLEHLSKEIGLCLRYCSVTFRGLRSDTFTVLGGEACNRDMLRLLSDQVNVPFRIGRPMQNIGGEMQDLGAERRAGLPEWATAVGLALKTAATEVEAAA